MRKPPHPPSLFMLNPNTHTHTRATKPTSFSRSLVYIAFVGYLIYLPFLLLDGLVLMCSLKSFLYFIFIYLFFVQCDGWWARNFDFWYRRRNGWKWWELYSEVVCHINIFVLNYVLNCSMSSFVDMNMGIKDVPYVLKLLFPKSYDINDVKLGPVFSIWKYSCYGLSYFCFFH